MTSRLFARNDMDAIPLFAFAIVSALVVRRWEVGRATDLLHFDAGIGLEAQLCLLYLQQFSTCDFWRP